MSSVTAKFIVIGDSGVGKTAILRRLIEDTFSDMANTTVGVTFESKILTLGDCRMKLLIWDTAGQERFKSIARAYYRNAIGVILVFDITDRTSFDNLDTWLNDVQVLCSPRAVVQLIGNKTDRATAREVSVAEAEAFAERHAMNYLETSARGGDGVTEAFVRAATTIMKKGLAIPGTLDQKRLMDEPVYEPGDQGGSSCC